MMFLPVARLLTGPLPPLRLAARALAAVILPPLLFFIVMSPLLAKSTNIWRFAVVQITCGIEHGETAGRSRAAAPRAERAKGLNTLAESPSLCHNPRFTDFARRGRGSRIEICRRNGINRCVIDANTLATVLSGIREDAARGG